MIMNDEICVILNVNLLNGFFNSKTTKKIKKKKWQSGYSDFTHVISADLGSLYVFTDPFL